MFSERLSPLQQEFVETYTVLNHQEKILFVTVLLYSSTLAGRGTYEEKREGVEAPARLRGINELQNRLSDHLLHLLVDDQKRRSEEDFLRLVLHLCELYQVSLSWALEKFHKIKMMNLKE
jgi:hypothetical protein